MTKDNIELPGWFQQKGESIEESALAELEEETGIKTTVENLKFLWKTTNNPTKLNLIAYYYLAENLEFNAKQTFDENEDIELIKVKPQKLLEMIKNEEIRAINAVTIIYKVFHQYPEIFN